MKEGIISIAGKDSYTVNKVAGTSCLLKFSSFYVEFSFLLTN